ncbi:MAG TPA: pyridoxamine 5'-phosphate oxidase family protein, partial [Verrucomicrobiae bacterium]|nr:pyridoxamine 5'-phosphate oxidase family protein [Verrucomicrobiae bacterium]
FFVATVNSEFGADASHRGGNPGFIHVLDERRIAFPDYAGNNMFQSLGNLQTDPRVGLLFLNFETGDTLQLTGKAEVHWDSFRFGVWPGAQRIVQVAVEHAVEIAHGFPLRFRLVEASPFNPVESAPRKVN